MTNIDLPMSDARVRSRWPRRVAVVALALMVSVVLAGAQVDRTPDGRFLMWPTERPPRPLAGREVKFPPYEVRTLPNGMQVIAVLHH